MGMIVVLLGGAVPVSADVNTPPGCRQLPPIFRWACEFRDDVVENIVNVGIALEREVRISQQQQALFGLGLGQRFRGGSLGQTEATVIPDNVSDVKNVSESTTTVTIQKDLRDYSKSPFAFSLYQENDGSKEDPDGIPTRYLKMQLDRREHAKKALHNTLEWREANDIDTILARPWPKFDLCKRVFPHHFCGRDDTNHVVLLMRPGLIDLDLGFANGLTGDDLLEQYIYETEYLWHILEPSANATMTSIIDLTGLNLSILTKREILSVVQKFCSTMDAHYPQRSHKTLLINSPKWFGAIYKLISPLLRESTKQKISILSKGKEQDQAIKDLLRECPLNSVEDMPPTQMEQDLRDFVSPSPVVCLLLPFSPRTNIAPLFQIEVCREIGRSRSRNAARHLLSNIFLDVLGIECSTKPFNFPY